eukprot:TRINITY_DN76399_c0_g1_i1.p2 TRINITY_DN76399_c0_g1~~TRINITY_DN76399_c0_g1_i1.p2  ORF type:complete len:170 (+),score=19.25 TRINITY_DN76399_c0_g1_i1:31-510(+)
MPKGKGAACPNLYEEIPCNEGTCDLDEQDRDCQLGEWGQWDECTKECGGGTKTRRRTIKQATSGRGRRCNPADMVETVPCNKEPCEKDKPADPPKQCECTSFYIPTAPSCGPDMTTTYHCEEGDNGILTCDTQTKDSEGNVTANDRMKLEKVGVVPAKK